MDPIAEWTEAQERVIALVEGLEADTAGRHVPATPDWTVHDLLAHMVGLGVDVVRGDEPDDHNSAWTQRQVDERASADVAAIVAEWRGVTEPLRQWMRDNGPRPLGDVIIHEQDLRGALGRPGAQDTAAFAAIRDRMAARVHAGVTQAGLPPLELAGPTWTVVLGGGDGTDTGKNGGDAAAAARLETSDFDLARALMSRRSADQVRSWVVRGDVEPYLDLIGALGPLPDRALPE
jgi:uncharacterized protein (TIGR03083 family)